MANYELVIPMGRLALCVLCVAVPVAVVVATVLNAIMRRCRD